MRPLVRLLARPTLPVYVDIEYDDQAILVEPATLMFDPVGWTPVRDPHNMDYPPKR